MINKREYQLYLRSDHWQKTRLRRLTVAGHQCEFKEETGQYKSYSLYGPRCTETADLEVHHLHYRSLGAEKDEDLEVLCRFHHLVREVCQVECQYCGEAVVVDDDVAIDIVKRSAQEYNVPISQLSTVMLDVDSTCWSCEETFTRD
jgi:hypothetical protein